MTTIFLLLCTFRYFYLAIKHFQLLRQNKKLAADVKFWKEIAFQNKPDLSDPKNADFLRP